jgi:NADH pyrophosphatase NudC (nudix superfamily)
MEKDTGDKERSWLINASAEQASRFLIWHKGKIAVSDKGTHLVWKSHDFLDRLRDLQPSVVPYEFDPKPHRISTVLLLLGKTKNTQGLSKVNVHDPNLLTPDAWRFAVDLSVLDEDALLALLSGEASTNNSLMSPRSLMGTLVDDPGAMAVAGITAARMNWHNEVQYCRKSGRRTVPTGAGHRRKDPEQDNHRQSISYPRTDPVAIMLVQSPGGDKCLLGRTKRRHNSNMYSCLAGFIEQAESVEDAVRREVEEEAGVEISNYEDVRLVGSQPWPIGAAGHSELMLGCIATAANETIHVNHEEMDDVRWFTREEAKSLLKRSTEKNVIGDATKLITVPPPYAIAHHLIKTWVETTENGREKREATTSSWNWNVVALSAGCGVILGSILTKVSSL